MTVVRGKVDRLDEPYTRHYRLDVRETGGWVFTTWQLSRDQARNLCDVALDRFNVNHPYGFGFHDRVR